MPDFNEEALARVNKALADAGHNLDLERLNVFLGPEGTTEGVEGEVIKMLISLADGSLEPVSLEEDF